MSNNYPMGAEYSPSCPWNKSEPKPVKVDCCVSYSLSKSMPVNVTDYNVSEDYESEVDDEGHRYCNKIQENDFDNTNFIEEFKNDDEAIGIPTLLSYLEELSDEKIESLKEELNMMKPSLGTLTEHKIKKEIKHYESILKACKGWIVDELDVCQE